MDKFEILSPIIVDVGNLQLGLSVRILSRFSASVGKFLFHVCHLLTNDANACEWVISIFLLLSLSSITLLHFSFFPSFFWFFLLL